MEMPVRGRVSRQRAGIAAACVVFLATTVVLWADVHVYEWNGTNFFRVAKIKSDTQSAIVCRGVCMPDVDCSVCHSPDVTRRPFTASVVDAHFKRYYAKGEILLAEGGSMRFGAMELRRLRSALMMVDPKTKRNLPLPAGTRILKGKDGLPWLHAPKDFTPTFSR
jgi:hypothetical protein